MFASDRAAAEVAGAPLFCAYSKPVGGQSIRTSIIDLEAKIGRPFGAHKSYFSWGQRFPDVVVKDDQSMGRVPFVNWKAETSTGSGSVDILWSDIANGSEDAAITMMADSIKKWGHPLFLSFHQEPENTDSAANGSAADFVAAYGRVHEIFAQQGVTNVSWVVTLMSHTYASGSAEQWYPGDWIDYVGVDGYNWSPEKQPSTWRSFEQIFAPAHSFAVAHAKQLIISEVGVQEDPAWGSANRKAQWLQDALATIKGWGDVKAFCYFNSDVLYQWWVTTSDASLAAFAQIGRDPYFEQPASQADLALTQSDSADPVTEGDSVTYTLTVTNGGPAAARNVVLADTLPSGAAFVSASSSQGSCIRAGTPSAILCNLGSLSDGGTATATVIVSTASAGTITNAAAVTSAAADPNPSDRSGTTGNGAKETTTVSSTSPPPSADLALSKTASASTVSVGERLTYTLDATNGGPDGATGVKVTDTLPAGVTFESASPGCAHSVGTVTCDFASIASGETATATVTVTAPSDSGTVTNSATVKGDQTDPTDANNTDSITTTVSPPADTTPPSVPTLTMPSAPFQADRVFGVAWSATDSDSGVASYDVRYRAAGHSGTSSAFKGHVLWVSSANTTAATFSGNPGTTYCFSAMARDGAGNASAWSPEKCTAVPVDDRSLTASGPWARGTASGYYLDTYSASSRQGSTLTLPSVTARRLAVVVTKCPTCGTLQVMWNTTILKKVSLASSTTLRRQLIALSPFSAVRTGKVTVKVVSSGKRVEVDGVGVSQT